jgi:xanthine permease XanP
MREELLMPSPPAVITSASEEARYRLPAKMRTRPRNLVFAVDERPPPRQLLPLGLQYAILDAIYLVLLAIILRHAHDTDAARVNAMGIACVAVAIGIVLQALPRGPVGSGYLAPPVFSATYLGPSLLAAELGRIPLVCGMTLFAGLVEALVGLTLDRLRIVVIPVLSGLTVFVVGLQLGVVGIGETLDVVHQQLPNHSQHLALAFVTLAIAVGLSIWGRGTVRMLGTMIGVAAGMAGATTIGLIAPDQIATIGKASWLALPRPIGGVSFSLALAPAFAAAGIAAALRTAGVVAWSSIIRHPSESRPEPRPRSVRCEQPHSSGGPKSYQGMGGGIIIIADNRPISSCCRHVCCAVIKGHETVALLSSAGDGFCGPIPDRARLECSTDLCAGTGEEFA